MAKTETKESTDSKEVKEPKTTAPVDKSEQPAVVTREEMDAVLAELERLREGKAEPNVEEDLDTQYVRVRFKDGKPVVGYSDCFIYKPKDGEAENYLNVTLLGENKPVKMRFEDFMHMDFEECKVVDRQDKEVKDHHKKQYTDHVITDFQKYTTKVIATRVPVINKYKVTTLDVELPDGNVIQLSGDVVN